MEHIHSNEIILTAGKSSTVEAFLKVGYGKCSNISNFSLSVLNYMRAGIRKIVVRIANREDPGQTASFDQTASVCTVCLGLLGLQLVFKF